MLWTLSAGMAPDAWGPPFLQLLGVETGQALQRSLEALVLAQDVSHPFSLGYALYFTAQLQHYRREVHATQERAEAVITLSRAQGFPTWLAHGTILQGWALAAHGQGEAGVAQIRQGIAAH
jgi:predicted ATPase